MTLCRFGRTIRVKSHLLPDKLGMNSDRLSRRRTRHQLQRQKLTARQQTEKTGHGVVETYICFITKQFPSVKSGEAGHGNLHLFAKQFPVEIAV